MDDSDDPLDLRIDAVSAGVLDASEMLEFADFLEELEFENDRAGLQGLGAKETKNGIQES